MNQIRVGDCISDGWNGFKKNAGISIGVIVIYGIITSVGGAIPVVNIAVSMVVTPVLTAGLAIFSLKIVRGGAGQVEDLFQGFNKFGSFLGAYWLYVCIVLAAFIPAAIGFGVDVAINGGMKNLFPYVTIGVSAVSLVILAIALIRFSMVNYLIIDGMPIIEAFKESARITKGFTGTLCLLALVNLLIILAGILLIFFGLLAAIPISMIAFAAVYPRLKGDSPAAVVPEPTSGV
jgi:uncharacterized membrane protein